MPDRTPPAQSRSVDGRVRRGERTRRAIVEALLELLSEGEYTPTSRQIATRAGVSVRSLFQHFEDLETLFAALVQVQAARVQPLVDALDPDGDLGRRISSLVRQRSDLFEAIAPIRHALGTRARDSAVLAGRIRDLSDVLYDQVREHFRDELAGAGGERLALAVDVLCSYPSWDHLRRHQGATVEQACEVLSDALERLFRDG
jgi:TetR/AcrR family transcriptional regulator, regulator of autoinduction and epiphytic fitness